MGVARQYFKKDGNPKKSYSFNGLQVLDSEKLSYSEFKELISELRFIDSYIDEDSLLITLKHVYPSEEDHEYFGGIEFYIGNLSAIRVLDLIAMYDVRRIKYFDYKNTHRIQNVYFEKKGK